MASANLTKCAKCGTGATMKCAGCADTPEYQPGDYVGVVYCGRDCQKEHWPSHKAHCKPMHQRKKLLRTAKILKVALLTYREVVFDLDLTGIDLRDGVLYIRQKPRLITAPAKRGRFPSRLTSNLEHKEAVLAHNQCTTAMALLGRLTRKLLAGVPCTIEVLDLGIEKPLVPTKLIPGPKPDGCPHTVLKLSLHPSNEVWILDSTGCQYGFRDVLVPYDTYLAKTGCRNIQHPTPYDASETTDLDFFSKVPSLNKTLAQRKNLDAERQARRHFAVFVESRVGAELLSGSDQQFRDRLEGFADQLKRHMLSLFKSQ